MQILSDIEKASSWSWVTEIVVIPRLWVMRLISNCMSWRRFLSRAPSGSSRRSSGGLYTMARARATRCYCPPESCLGKRSSSPVSFTRAIMSLTRLSTSSCGSRRTFSG